MIKKWTDYNLTKQIKDFFDDTSKFVFWSTALIMFIAHGFSFANIMYSHDSLDFANIEGLGKVHLGRWLYPFLVHRRLVATPWLIGMMSIIFVSLAAVLVSKVLKLNKAQGLCVGILFAANITLTSLFRTFIYDADADCLALLLVCFGVYAFRRFPKILNIIVPIIAFTLSLALYQAYVCVGIGLFLIVLIQDALDSTGWKDILSIVITGFKEITVLLLGMLTYVPLMHMASNYYGMELWSGRNGPGKLSSLTISEAFKLIPGAYKYFYDTFFSLSGYNSPRIIKVNWIVVILIVCSVVYYVLTHKKHLYSLVIIIPCLLLLPLGLNAIYVVSFGAVHELMIYAFCLIYLIPLIITSGSEASLINLKRVISFVTIICVICVGLNNIVYSNGAYVYKKLIYDNTLLHAQTIWEDVNKIEGYREGETKVVFVGDFAKAKTAYYSSNVNMYTDSPVGTGHSSISYSGTEVQFYYSILGRKISITPPDEEIRNNPEFKEMPTYPSEGYCKMIDGKVVVKLEDVEN